MTLQHYRLPPPAVNKKKLFVRKNLSCGSEGFPQIQFHFYASFSLIYGPASAAASTYINFFISRGELRLQFILFLESLKNKKKIKLKFGRCGHITHDSVTAVGNFYG